MLVYALGCPCADGGAVAARRLLADAFLGSRDGQRTLEEEIQAQHDLRDEEFVAGQAL